MAGLTWKDVFDIGLQSYDRANQSATDRAKMKYQKDIDDKNYKLALKKEERDQFEIKQAGYAFSQSQIKGSIDEFKTREEAIKDLEMNKGMIVDLYGEKVYEDTLNGYNYEWDKKEADKVKSQKVWAERKQNIGDVASDIKEGAKNIFNVTPRTGSPLNVGRGVIDPISIGTLFGQNAGVKAGQNYGRDIGLTPPSQSSGGLTPIIDNLIKMGINPQKIAEVIPQVMNLFNKPQQQPQQVAPQQNQMFQQ